MDTVQTKKFESREELMEALKKERNLTGADLSGLDLSGIKLFGMSMKGADLHNSNLTGAKLAGLDMREVDLSNAYLDKANIAGADLRETTLRGAHMDAVKMAGVDLREADLTGADLSHSRLVAVDVKGADFSDVKTTEARSAVEWSAAKVPPAELPEPVISPPRWVVMLAAGVIALAVFGLVWRRIARREKKHQKHRAKKVPFFKLNRRNSHQPVSAAKEKPHKVSFLMFGRH